MRIMTTFRLLRQTSRSCRFAQVTVDVDPLGGPGVEVAGTVAAEFRREADLGARWALRSVPAAKVTVTAVVTTDVDTGTADVYEATARAVWQALGVQHSVPYVGFSDPQMIASLLTRMIGRSVSTAAATSCYWRRKTRTARTTRTSTGRPESVRRYLRTSWRHSSGPGSPTAP